MPETRDDIPTRYVPFLTVFSVLGAAAVHAVSRRDEHPPDPLELAEAALATFFLTRVVAKERVGAVVRDPFVEQKPGADPTDLSGEVQRATGTGMRRTIGELVTCTRCLGPWAATIVTVMRAFLPRHGRVATRVMALAGLNTILHSAHAAACAAANVAPTHPNAGPLPGENAEGDGSGQGSNGAARDHAHA